MGIQPRTLLRKLPDPVSLGERRWLPGAVQSPLERNPQSPRGWKNRDSDGVGLGIAVALEKAGGGESPRKVHAATAPIAIGSPRTNGPRGCLEASQLGCSARHSSAGVCGGERAQGGELRWKGEGFCCNASPSPAVAVDFQVADFLSKCHLCRKKLQGKDIYMYREKAFCTTECRYQQIVSDEYQEKFGAPAPKTASPEIASSPYSSDQLFFTGIVVS